ncbi:coiled-coil-helix-coiled-coil-helix domain containing 3a isoform X2 [Carassius carassius]|uniref:coiled-coil-helix-coiled-coil-helix domain containing 3a isoform X2 n=1 Tax=Carassius carassius TaxID=217509 RepID=UPI002869755B|nr:coiled-coil-helix-coiled-coil-helix domain containing 3a isoform X2 [Carassius carassius]
MGANNSTRRVSFESDENENITIVKGIRLSEKVIDRMREPSGPPQPPTRAPPASPPLVDPLPALVPISPPPDPVTPLPSSSLPERVKLSEQVNATGPPPALAEPLILPPPPPVVTAPAESVGAVSAPAVYESELRRKIAEELQKSLEEERRKAREDLNQRLEKEKSQAHAEAQAEAQAQVKDEVSRILALEKEQSIQKAILRERITAEDERLQAQIYARQLEERDKELRKQDAFYREQVAKLKERSAQFYKVTNENHHKAADEVNAKFKRYEISPVCTDLQGQILKCYRENAGKTLLCSNIASQYMQCVNSAKQDKLRTGG